MDQFLRKHLWVINLVSLALLAFFLATGVGSLLSTLLVPDTSEEGVLTAPSLAQKRRLRKRGKNKRFERRSGRDICANNIFNYKNRPCAEDLVADLSDEEFEQEESSGVPDPCDGGPELVATLASTDPSWSFAMIKNDGKTEPYRAGQAISGFGKIERVGWRFVLVDQESGPNCFLDLYPPAGGEKTARATPRPDPPTKGKRPRRRRGKLPDHLQKQVDEGIQVVSATERNIDRGLVESLVENSSSLMNQARVLPYERDGQIQGFKLYGIRRNSLLGKLGLRNGDIVNSIGGIDMVSPDRALQAFTTLRNSSHISLTFTRRGQRQNMDFNIR